METVNKYIEHTLLKADAKSEDIEGLIKEAIENKFLGVCINPNFVKFAHNMLDGSDIKLVTVVNFPLASNTIETVLFQTEAALKDGANEIDTVINLSSLKDKDYKKVASDIQRTKEIAKDNILKVIIETDLLNQDEIIAACKCAIEGGCDFVKTSTGFVKGGVGAKIEDVELMYKTVHPYGLNVKASGGIKDYNKALLLIKAGAIRLGTSSGVQIISK